MKKTFELTHPKIKPARLADAAKHEVKKYLKRERNKKPAEGADLWDFNCKFGNTEQEAIDIHVSQISKSIEEAEQKQWSSFYLEILATPGIRKKKTDPDLWKQN
jgi:hypothetical protein